MEDRIDYERIFNKTEQIYNALCDEKSKFIFRERLLYSMTGIIEHIVNIVGSLVEGQELLQIMRSNKEIFIFGAGTWGSELGKLWPNRWAGFLDNNSTRWGKEKDGIPIKNPKEVDWQNYDGLIFVCTRLYYEEICHQLIDMGVKEEQIINVGETIDLMSQKQYFDLEFLPHISREVFADVGSLDGMSAVFFADWSKHRFDKIYCFEPDAENCKKVVDVLTQNEIINQTQLIRKGAWSSNGSLSFRNQGNGTSSFLVDCDDEVNEVEVIALDDVFQNEHVSFIKMDIEGAELEAIKGCEATIRRERPKLAISIYHKPEDIIEIAAKILEYCPDYHLYIRHYSIAFSETVLYAI